MNFVFGRFYFLETVFSFLVMMKIETVVSINRTVIFSHMTSTLNPIVIAESAINEMAVILARLEIARFSSQFFKAVPISGWR